MGAKLSRRKSETAAESEGVAAENTATEQAETAEAVAPNENNEQKPDEAQDANEPRTTEKAPVEDTSSGEAASNLGAVETITQAVEQIVSNVTEQISAPVEDIVHKGMGAVEAMMAAISVKEDPTEPAALVAEKGPEAEPLVDLSMEAAPKVEFSMPEPPEKPAYLSSEPSTLDELLSSQPIADSLLPESVTATVTKDVSPLAVKEEGLPIQIEAQASSDSEEKLVCMTHDATSSEDPQNCEANANPTNLNSDPLVDLGDTEQVVSTAINVVNDLI
ncbi:enolase-phosphatase E1 [Hoplias malabaricus]|uniref:enolase-phosphatase E1 n=1 Tax=Hoplias malabaricus TaxID=27720 RepID=UPI003463749A